MSLKEGHLIFKFGIGENHGEVQYRTKETYNDGRLHTVSVHRVSRKITINVDDGRFGTHDSRRLPAVSSKYVCTIHGYISQKCICLVYKRAQTLK